MTFYFDWEADMLLWIQDNLRNGAFSAFFKTITHLGDAGIFWILLTVVLMFFKKTRPAAITSAIALILSLILNNMILKPGVGRTRPYELIENLKCIVKLATDKSFPSGHTAASFASATALATKLPKKINIPLFILAALISFSRLYVGIHYPTDVLAGLIDGVILGILAALIYKQAVKIYTNKMSKE